jgi:hypothetical protein
MVVVGRRPAFWCGTPFRLRPDRADHGGRRAPVRCSGVGRPSGLGRAGPTMVVAGHPSGSLVDSYAGLGRWGWMPRTRAPSPQTLLRWWHALRYGSALGVCPSGGDTGEASLGPTRSIRGPRSVGRSATSSPERSWVRLSRGLPEQSGSLSRTVRMCWYLASTGGLSGSSSSRRACGLRCEGALDSSGVRSGARSGVSMSLRTGFGPFVGAPGLASASCALDRGGCSERWRHRSRSSEAVRVYYRRRVWRLAVGLVPSSGSELWSVRSERAAERWRHRMSASVRSNTSFFAPRPRRESAGSPASATTPSRSSLRPGRPEPLARRFGSCDEAWSWGFDPAGGDVGRAGWSVDTETGLIRSLAEGHRRKRAVARSLAPSDARRMGPGFGQGSPARRSGGTLEGVEHCGSRRRPWRHGWQPRVFWIRAAGRGWRHPLPVSWGRRPTVGVRALLAPTGGGFVDRVRSSPPTADGGRRRTSVARRTSPAAGVPREVSSRADGRSAGCGLSAAADGDTVPMRTASVRGTLAPIGGRLLDLGPRGRGGDARGPRSGRPRPSDSGPRVGHAAPGRLRSLRSVCARAVVTPQMHPLLVSVLFSPHSRGLSRSRLTVDAGPRVRDVDPGVRPVCLRSCREVTLESRGGSQPGWRHPYGSSRRARLFARQCRQVV